MSPSKYAAAALFAASVLATPNPQASTTPSAASTEPSEFTANPNVGAGGNTFTDSPRFRVYGATGDEADKALQMLESAYTCFVTDLGWRSSSLSYNSDSDTADIRYKENIYLVNSLGNAAGVMNSDPETGLSYVQVVDTYLTDPSVTVHEYGHALTYHAQNWVDQAATGAWWEPLANWFAETWMTSDICASAREKYSQQARNSMIELKKVIGDSHQVIVDGSVDSGNYYQSWPILSYLTNNPDNFTGLGQDAVLRLNLEYEVGSNETPLHTLQRLLGNRATVQQVVGRYWAHMAYVDIGSEAANRAFLEQRETLGYENLDGSGQSYTVKAARQPQYFGANINPIQVSGEGSVSVTVKSNSVFTSTLAVRNKDSGAVRYVDLENGSGEVTVGGSEEASLVADEQVAEVNALMSAPLKDGQKGFVVSMAWLKKVLARTTAHADHTDKGPLEGDVGPVNNLNIMLDTDPATPSFKDETGETFVPMRPGLQESLDFAIIPQRGWDLIQKWYGLADQSPVIIRYAHNTSQPGDTEKIEYETYPPIFTIFKLANPAAGTTPTILRQTIKPSVKILASRQTNYQKWLKDAKEQTGIDMSTKVRVWKILQLPHSTTASASATPAASRSQSPAPPLALISNPNDKLLFDLNAFLELPEGSHRVLLENVKDQTQNANYNGRMTLDMAGLSVTNCVVLEEQVGSSKGGEWVSEASVKTLKSLGIPVDQPKNNAVAKVSTTKDAPKSTPSGRTTPTPGPDPIRGLISRGRKGRQVIVGLQNLGNTCYMNSALQCVRSIEELSYYFLSGMYKPELNPGNVLGCGGTIAKQWANLLQELYKSDPQPRSVNPYRFRSAAGRQREDFAGYEQHDSQEFVMFLLDALSEDLSRIVGSKPSTVIPDSTDEMIHDRKALEDFGKKCWDLYEARNASVITDLFAGMYKSTLICHNCEKTSIIMDPFTMVTVPIPTGPTLINRTIIFYPLDGPPVSLKVRLDEHDPLKAWKDFVAQKMGIDGERIFAAETLHNSFWQTFCDDDDTFGSLRITHEDTIVFYDLGPLPASTNSSDSTNDDAVLVPVFHRKLVPRKNKEGTLELFGIPSFIRLSSEESRDLETIYRKLLTQANNMTTQDIFAAQDNSHDDNATDDSDTVVTNEDDARSADSRIKTSSVDGEDSIVDISMQTEQGPTPAEGTDESDSDSDSESVKSPQHPLAGKFPASLLSLFDATVMSTPTTLPDGRNISTLKTYPSILSRIPSPPTSTKGSDASSKSSADDNLDDDVDTEESDPTPKSAPALVHQGDAILLDWTSNAIDSLFSGKPRDPEELRGRPTFMNIKNVFDHTMVVSQQKPKLSTVPLDQCLDEFSKEEILSRADSWFCPQCKTHVSATKKFELWRTPDIMVVQLKRFSQFRGRNGHKISTLIDFPFEGLDLSSRVVGPMDGKSAVYDLIAVDNHLGGMGGGHYTAYIKDFVTGDWIYCNDTSAKIVTDMRSIITPGAYLLFYRRRSDRALGNQELRELVEGYRNSEGSVSGSSSRSRSPGGSQSPSGDGGRVLGGAPRKGSSALAGAGVAPRVSRGQDSLGNDLYSSAEESTSGSEDGGSEGKKIDFEHENGGSQVDSLNKLTEPSWSFDAAHDISQITGGNAATEDGIFEGRCPWGDGMDIDPHVQFGLTSGSEGEDSSDDLPVVELRVGSEDIVMSSDP